MRERAHGHSLLECVVAIGLFGLISALTSRFLQLSCSQLGTTKAALDQRMAILKSASVISGALSALERTHMLALVSTTSGSNPTAPHGGPHPIHSVGATSQPRADSDILSSLEIDPVYQGRIVETQLDSNGVTVTVCGGGIAPGKDQFRSHLLLGLGGICQVTGTPEALPAGCFLLRGTAVRGMISNSNQCPGGSYHEYRPISREISLYVDKTGEFRLISHVGLRLLENQPITRGLRSLTIRRLNASPEATFFTFALRGSTTRSFNFILPSGMAGGSLWNEVLL